MGFGDLLWLFFMISAVQPVIRQKMLEVLADVSRKAIVQLHKMVQELLGERMARDAATTLADKLTTGTWTHDYGIFSEEAKELGLPVSTDMPEDVYDFMALFPQPTRLRSAVEYVPMPYRGARQGR